MLGGLKGYKGMDLRDWLSGVWGGFGWCLLDDEDSYEGCGTVVGFIEGLD